VFEPAGVAFPHPPGYADLVILVIDNYDSFTYNLVQRIGELGLDRDIRVVRNDVHTVEELGSWKPSHIIISPGPGTPDDAGISMDLIRTLGSKVPILGVCLGHQCIGQAFGAKVVRAGRIMHGKTSAIQHDGRGVFREVVNPFVATRYHSLVVEPSTVPGEFDKTAWTDRKELMGLRHKSMPIEGVQFHPESFLTDVGYQLLANFLQGTPSR
jgi:anthranilate synthase/aminodeoxychorismate synthase-like glutamine amidotransferase